MRSSSTSDTKRDKREPDLSLEEMFARDVERLELTPEKVRSAMDARHSVVRKKLLADYGLTEETLDSAAEATKSELASKLMYELAHSPDAKLEHGLYEAAIARENRLLVKRKAEEILTAQRKRALNVSVPQKLVPAVQERSTRLFYSELRDHFRSKYIEKIEKSDLLIPEFKAAALKAEEPHMPNLYEVAAEMSAELLHPDAFGQILAEHHAATQAATAKKTLDTVSAIPWWIWLIPIAVVLVATARLPYGYYMFARLVVCAFTAFVALFNFLEDSTHRSWPVILGLIAVLFNPVIPIHLSRATWLYLDIGTAVVLAAHLVFVRLRWLNKVPSGS